MGDDQVVARELEQAEARLMDARHAAWDAAWRDGGPNEIVLSERLNALRDLAIEVGRLRALAEVESALIEIASLDFVELRAHGISVGDKAIGIARAALAAREEVTG